MDNEKQAIDSQYFRRIVEMSPDAIIVADSEGRILLWNPAAEVMFDYFAYEALKLKICDIIPEQHRSAHIEGVKRFLETEKPVLIGRTVEVTGLRKGGGVFPVELSLFAEKDSHGWTFMSIARDITARKKAEEQMARQSNTLQRINSEMQALLEISSEISHTIDTDALLTNVINAIVELDAFKRPCRGGIFILDDGKMRLAAHVGHTREFLVAHTNIKVGDCLCGQVARTGEVIVSDSSSTDARHTIRYQGMQPHGHVIVPLKANNDIIGVMYLYLSEGVKLEAPQKDMLVSIGMQLGVAVRNLRLYEETKALSLRDPLTGLANRRFMQIEMDRNLSNARRYGRLFSVIMMDLDHFKKYNDTYGHPAGDAILSEFAALIQKTIREADLGVRYGGEEFLLLLPETGAIMAATLGERLRMIVEGALPVTVSIGVTSFDNRMREGTELICLADAALYKAKQKGRNRVEMLAYDSDGKSDAKVKR